ncbi:la protein homolog [Hyposmocoma kahamanoa]|uniref:la protein homolog n=1 Tax=Hyposmocoma kahamanoa TaxID=1477025 RepID=UPI000E6D831C|nr:la protein homolog [Hyposmocoma kahamanoa]
MTEQEAFAGPHWVQEIPNVGRPILERAVVRQMEFYFGDMNIDRDNFMREQIELEDGWVPLAVLIRFNCLANLSKDIAFVANAVKNSNSKMLEVSDDNQKIRRSPKMPVQPITPERRKEIKERTLYIKGFPLNTKLDDLLKYFNEFAEMDMVIMRYCVDESTKQLSFKGSIFATFKDRDDARMCMVYNNLVYGKNRLTVLWEEDYFAAKTVDKNKPVTPCKVPKLYLPTGSVLYFTKEAGQITRDHIQLAMATLGGVVAYIDHANGSTHGWVRYKVQNAAVAVYNKLKNGTLQIRNTTVSFRLLEGEEEADYLNKASEAILRRERFDLRKQNAYSLGVDYAHEFDRKRKPEQHNEEPASKRNV